MKAFIASTLLAALLPTAASAQAFKLLEANEALRHGDVVSFVVPRSGQWLAAERGDETGGAVQLVPQDRGERSVTRWRVEEPAQGIFSFRCLGIGDGPMWLNGLTLHDRVITSLSPVGVSGAAWGIYREGAGFTLKCLGKAAGARWLAVNANQVCLVREETAEPTVWQVRVWSRALDAAPPER